MVVAPHPPLPPPSLSPPVSSPEDAQIATAISEWLAALSPASPSPSFEEQRANPSLAMCQVFSSFAPHILSERDFFTPTTAADENISRRARYNIRRLARSLSEWFTLPSSEKSALNNPPSPPPVYLSSSVQEALHSTIDSPLSDESQVTTVLLILAEVLLCAAVHSSERGRFIEAVLTLSQTSQDVLAYSIRRTTVDHNSPPQVLSDIALNDENLARVDVKPSKPPIRGSSPDPISAPRGVALADYKALINERDNLRKKLTASEFEKNRTVEASDALRVSLEEANDKIRDQTSRLQEIETDMAGKTKALNDANNALRDAHVSAEEVDILRAKAASAEQLQASLKRASTRLEEVAETRKNNKELEAQVSAFRESEERNTKHIEYLESQLKSSNERNEQLAALTDSLSEDLEDKEHCLETAQNENAALHAAVTAANNQLASYMIQSTHTTSHEHAKSKSENFAEQRDCTSSSASATQVNCQEEQTIIPTSQITLEQFEEVLSNMVYGEVGMRMTWHDVKDCVIGVVDAMKEMDGNMDDPNFSSSDMQRMQSLRTPSNPNASDKSLPCVSNSLLASGQVRLSDRSVPSGTDTHDDRSVQSGTDTHDPEVGSDVESRMSLLPSFGDLDQRLAANAGVGDDEFDFAATHVNVEEIVLPDKQSSQPSALPKDGAGLEGSEGESCLQSSSYTSTYQSDLTAEAETIKHTSPVALCEGRTADRSRSYKSVSRSANERYQDQPHSPYIASNFEGSVPNTQGQGTVSAAGNTAERKSPSIVDGNTKVAAAMSVKSGSGFSRSTSHSETTRSLVRQARKEMSALQNAMEVMRSERQSCASVNVLVQQLDAARQELKEAQDKLRDSDSECGNLRRELNLLLKEVDTLSLQSKLEERREKSVLKEKERLIGHLKTLLKQKEEELAFIKQEVLKNLGQLEVLRESQKASEEKVRAAAIVEAAQEVEIARLTAKLTCDDVLETKLNAMVKGTDGWKNHMSMQRESHLNDIAAATKREKQLAEEARDEARRMAQTNARVLADVRASATAAAIGRSRGVEDRCGFAPRKSSRFYDFWRKLLHLEKVTIDYSMPASASTATGPVEENQILQQV